MSVLNINIEELLKELDPATLQALEQLLVCLLHRLFQGQASADFDARGGIKRGF